MLRDTFKEICVAAFPLPVILRTVIMEKFRKYWLTDAIESLLRKLDKKPS